MENRIHAYFRGELNEKERLALLKGINSDPSLKKQFIEIKNIYALSLLSGEAGDMGENYASYDSFMKGRRRKRLYGTVLRIARYAAAVIVIVISTCLVTLRTMKPADPSSMMHSLHVPAGQRLKFSLPDGTDVWLNARTTLRFPLRFDGGERRVVVEGEALFEVAEDVRHPFIVSSKGVEMKVLGTRFNVYGYPEADYVRAGLLSGSLNVRRESEKTDGVVLKPNQQATVGDGYFTVEPVSDPEYFLWTEGIYSFKEEPLINILRKLELYFDVKITVEDPHIYTWEYTGKFRQRDGIEGILHIIQKIHNFKIEKNEENNTITLS
jgi:ferric-dicitrate binding protein FerR (iron transport regulator)